MVDFLGEYLPGPITPTTLSKNTRTSPAGAWGAEGFNAEGITLVGPAELASDPSNRDRVNKHI